MKGCLTRNCDAWIIRRETVPGRWIAQRLNDKKKPVKRCRDGSLAGKVMTIPLRSSQRLESQSSLNESLTDSIEDQERGTVSQSSIQWFQKNKDMTDKTKLISTGNKWFFVCLSVCWTFVTPWNSLSVLCSCSLAKCQSESKGLGNDSSDPEIDFQELLTASSGVNMKNTKKCCCGAVWPEHQWRRDRLLVLKLFG